MNTWEAGERPITIAILAMGGEGGGVLSDWIVAMGETAGFTAQSTSVAGVAQRTGATVYYVELYPPTSVTGGARSEPVLSLFPAPGQVDIVIASELMEAGRAIQRGFATPDRTTLIASTNRVYAVTEKIILGDGRVDSESLLESARVSSRRLVSADFNQLAVDAGSVISASLFGALARSESLPFSRNAFEDALRASGKGVERSLAAFAKGFEAAEAALAPPPKPTGMGPIRVTIGKRPPKDPEVEAAEKAEERHRELSLSDPAQLMGPALRVFVPRIATFPSTSRSMLIHGIVKTAVYQDADYAGRYLDRVAVFCAFDADTADAELTTEVARQTALWMAYQDTVHVAYQKLRTRRFEAIRKEAKAKDGQLTQVREFLHPQVEEITDTLPTALGRALSRSKLFAKVVGKVTKDGMIINTTSVFGFTMLRIMAGVRPLRPRSLRFGREQAAIDAWLRNVHEVAGSDYALACEVARIPRVLKGYGATHAHGEESFRVLMDAVPRVQGRENAAGTLARLTKAALADETGEALARAMTAAVPVGQAA